MLISACPINAVARMVDTPYYLSVSSIANGVVYKTDANQVVNMALDQDIVTSATVTTYTSKFVTLAQVGSSTNVLLGGILHMYDYSTGIIIKTSTSATVLNYLDCIDSSTCIGYSSSVNDFFRITTNDFLGSTLDFTQVSFSSSIIDVPQGIRCFANIM